MAMPANRYAHVALTYTTRLALRLWAAGTAAYATWLLCMHEADYGSQLTILILGGTLAAMGGTLVAAHAKEQLADWRARLTPGFRKPHLVVAAVAFLIAVVGVSAVTVLRYTQVPRELGWPAVAVSSSGFMALVLLAATSWAWMSHLGSPRFVFTMMALAGVVGFTARGREVMVGVISGTAAGLTNGLLGASVAALAALWWRLGTMHEERGEYFRIESFNTRVRAAMTGDRYFRQAAAVETGWLSEFLQAAHRLDRLSNVFRASFWRRARHWRLVIGHGRAGPLAGAALAVAGLVHVLVSSRSGDAEIALFMIMPLVFSLIVPVTMTASLWPQRWHMLAGESLRPVKSRGRFFREQGAAMAWELASCWAWLTAGGFTATLIFRPSWLLTTQAACTLLVSAAAQVFLFAVSVWVLRLRMGLFLNFGVLMLTLAFVGYAARQVEGPGSDVLRTPSPAWAAALVAIGTLITLDAYRRWLKTDLD
jgi:hypothetical protein